MNFSEWQQICDAAQLGAVEHFDRINSADNHASWQLITTKGCYFTKTTLQRYAQMLLSEAKNLTAINNTHSLHSPQVVHKDKLKKQLG
jgi:fructosamine-3-kinase